MVYEIISIIIAIAGTVFGTTYWQKFRNKVSQFRKFIETLDDALYDNAITEAEYDSMWEQFKELVGYNEEK